ncbi:FtsX-like permease family protein [Virgibacillus oceani]|uniref:Permease n=1 Tax=Virgibacillus oceani TaxID=1479511 RepID=A0A917HBL9_9BACI|nr:ABC transporter permease [Virgibacillus oceani]GGG74379.1 permease [Virgibacillus oceani]
MVVTLWKKLFRTIKEKKAQYLAAWVLIVISSALFYSFTAAGTNLVDNLDTFYQTNHVEDANFVVQDPLKKTDKLEEQFDLQLERRLSVDVPMKEDTIVRLLNETHSIDTYSVIEGRKLQSDQDILIDQGFAKAHDISIGDQLDLSGEQFVVKGTMAIPDYIYPLRITSGFLKNPSAFGVAIVQGDVLKNMPNTHSYYSVRFNQDNKETFKHLLNENNHVLQWIGKQDNNRITFIQGDIAAVKKMGESLPIGILLITLVIILILLWRLMKKEYVQIGTLYAIGYKKSEIVRHYLTYAALLALSGSIVGTLLGWLLMHPLISVFSAYYNLPVLTTNPHAGYLLISLLLPLVFFVPLTYILVRRVLRIPPVILMKGGRIKTKVNKVERIFKLRNLKFAKKFILRDIFRNLPRIGFLSIGVMFATLLLLMGFITKDSMTYLVHDNFTEVYHYKYEYTFNQLQTEPPQSGQPASSIPSAIETKEGDQSLVLTGLEPDNSAIQLKDMDGNRLKFDSVIINKSLADKLDIAEGDKIEVTSQLSNKTFPIRIDHIANSYLGDMIYMPLEQLNQLNDYPKDSYMALYSDKELAIPKEKLASKSLTDNMVTGFEQIIQPLNYGIIAIALVAAIIAVIIIYILISLLIEENSYKISLMKVIGYNERTIQKLMIGYNVWFVILGFFIAIPITLVSISAFLNSITAEMNITIPVKIDWVNIAISFFVILAAYYVTLLLNKRLLKKVSMHEAINKSTE